MGARGIDKAVEAFAAAAAGDIEPPDTLTLDPKHLRLWTAVTRVRARSEWTEIDLHHAASLVRCLADIDRIYGEVLVEGDVIENNRGTMITNPKHRLLNDLHMRATTLTRLLQLHAQAMVPDARKLIPGRKAEQKVREELEEMDQMLPPGMDGADLLARPEWRQ